MAVNEIFVGPPSIENNWYPVMGWTQCIYNRNFISILEAISHHFQKCPIQLAAVRRPYSGCNTIAPVLPFYMQICGYDCQNCKWHENDRKIIYSLLSHLINILTRWHSAIKYVLPFFGKNIRISQTRLSVVIGNIYVFNQCFSLMYVFIYYFSFRPLDA